MLLERLVETRPQVVCRLPEKQIEVVEWPAQFEIAEDAIGINRLGLAREPRGKGSVAKFSCFQIYSQLISVLLRLIPQLVRIMAIDFKGCHYPKSVVLYAVAFYLRYPVSYRDLEEIMAERGVDIDHATLIRWVVRFSPLLADQAKLRKRPASSSWRMDDTNGINF